MFFFQNRERLWTQFDFIWWWYDIFFFIIYFCKNSAIQQEIFSKKNITININKVSHIFFAEIIEKFLIFKEIKSSIRGLSSDFIYLSQNTF